MQESKKNACILAAKCAPNIDTLAIIQKAGINAVELYLDERHLKNADDVRNACLSFPFCYAIHAPTTGFAPEQLRQLTVGINAGIVVLHDIYFPDEWEIIAQTFRNVATTVCVENTSSANEPVKYQRRYGFGCCLDLEHVQLECCGVVEHVFPSMIRNAKHLHTTGYFHGSDKWHSHLHHSPEHGRRMLDMIYNAGYRGMVVSEAQTCFQTTEEFQQLRRFFDEWERTRLHDAPHEELLQQGGNRG